MSSIAFLAEIVLNYMLEIFFLEYLLRCCQERFDRLPRMGALLLGKPKPRPHVFGVAYAGFLLRQKYSKELLVNKLFFHCLGPYAKVLQYNH